MAAIANNKGWKLPGPPHLNHKMVKVVCEGCNRGHRVAVCSTAHMDKKLVMSRSVGRPKKGEPRLEYFCVLSASECDDLLAGRPLSPSWECRQLGGPPSVAARGLADPVFPGLAQPVFPGMVQGMDQGFVPTTSQMVAPAASQEMAQQVVWPLAGSPAYDMAVPMGGNMVQPFDSQAGYDQTGYDHAMYENVWLQQHELDMYGLPFGVDNDLAYGSSGGDWLLQ